MLVNSSWPVPPTSVRPHQPGIDHERQLDVAVRRLEAVALRPDDAEPARNRPRRAVRKCFGRGWWGLPERSRRRVQDQRTVGFKLERRSAFDANDDASQICMRGDDEVVLEVRRLLANAHVHTVVHAAVNHRVVRRDIRPPRRGVAAADKIVYACSLFLAGEHDTRRRALEDQRDGLRIGCTQSQPDQLRLECRSDVSLARGESGRTAPLPLVLYEARRQAPGHVERDGLLHPRGKRDGLNT